MGNKRETKSEKFSRYNPLDNLSGKNITSSKETMTHNEEAKAAAEPKPKRKVGRPKIKTEPTKTINIAVPVSVLEKLDTVKVCYGNNLTQYINKLIEKDIEANYDNYKNIADSLNTFK